MSPPRPTYASTDAGRLFRRRMVRARRRLEGWAIDAGRSRGKAAYLRHAAQKAGWPRRWLLQLAAAMRARTATAIERRIIRARKALDQGDVDAVLGRDRRR